MSHRPRSRLRRPQPPREELLRRAAELRAQQQAVADELQALYEGLGELPEAERAAVLEALGGVEPAGAPPQVGSVAG